MSAGASSARSGGVVSRQRGPVTRRGCGRSMRSGTDHRRYDETKACLAMSASKAKADQTLASTVRQQMESLAIA